MEQLVDERTRWRDVLSQGLQLGERLTLGFDHESRSTGGEVQPITRPQTQGSPDLGRNDESSLFAQDNRGIHAAMIPPAPPKRHGESTQVAPAVGSRGECPAPEGA
ncbi:hypothetical protein J2S59_001441 [Nocardioides massiliensis]|uniref:Uncharacterized protein n=1 Tax=Nocardioides massiliensis TaxID=1325935 RepID=A0ABT9NMI6_9ACTN|nr:hypothetical protein [Nocardioides massiliensis]MDP9821632.1 hypothetical protein [Nocardioides massiliensis]